MSLSRHPRAGGDPASSDSESLITEHIDLWTSSIKAKNTQGRGSSKKRELYGIKKLRELILELAVRGKLVPQDPNEEPASELLKRIAEEKAQLIKDKKIKKQKLLPKIIDEEKPFDLPVGWEWVRVGYIGSIFNGNSVNAQLKEEKYTNIEGLPFIATKDVGYGFEPFDYSNGICIPVGEPKFKVARAGSVLICAEGGSAGKKCGIANRDVCFGNKLFANELYGEVSPAYILSNYLTPTFYGSFSDAMTGIIGGISTSKFFELVIPIPPINEQHRIVAKVDELMTLCDQLEQQTETSLDAHKLLVDTLLASLLKPAEGSLTDAHDANELSDNWARLADHFDTLITTDYAVEQLKQTILQLAVMGKLVPQDPNDEPASELLKRIAVEKEQLIKDKKIKKQKQLPEISDEDNPSQLPAGWVFERLGNFTIVGTGATPSRSNPSYWEPGDINWVSSGETSALFLEETKEKVSDLAVKETNVSVYPIGTLIVAMYGQGKTRGQITELRVEAGTNQACAAIRLIDSSECHRLYVKLFFQKSYFELREQAAGGAQPNLNVGKISEMVLLLPPLKEQQRIVAKVEQLMALCDQLKARLNDAQTTQLHLADAVVDEALN
jgi:type I restriction enzyme S subunit